MTNEEKQILIKDLSARLPYGVKCRLISVRESKEPRTIVGLIPSFELFLIDKKTIFGPTEEGYNIELIKPYLRKMLSMTAEERQEYEKTFEMTDMFNIKTLRTYFWLLEHHFDIRGLIEKGLAIEAPEGMYIK